jgi:hypothetical protein
VILLGYDSQQVQSVAAIGHCVVVSWSFARLCPQQCFLAFLELVSLHATQRELVPVGICLTVLKNGSNLVELAFGHVAICQKPSGLFIVSFGQQSFGQKCGVGVNVVINGLVDGLDELGLEEAVGDFFLHLS